MSPIAGKFMNCHQNASVPESTVGVFHDGFPLFVYQYAALARHEHMVDLVIQMPFFYDLRLMII